ncbi:hypothetical protein KG088_04170 [Halomonas sp. TRM85114]|uniref:hypothetical protein n=1 Tax=Halomonas jincaotanensis TaxID=2810616 RepID=UPI001BD43836|nr:hypothetical protein [Halomonas jincaotanensis]MBS9402817.1 hypothetical protein [Halomonas jincaotanensis]
MLGLSWRHFLTLALALLFSGIVTGDVAVTRPFTAHYQLSVSGWPDATIEHRLSREGNTWQSQMRARIAVARGNERSRFVVEPDGIRSVVYASGYSLLGIGKTYRLGAGELAALPDRQAALFELSRQAARGDCQPRCRLRYQDHKGEAETLLVRHLGPRQVSLPAGDFEAVAVEVTEPDEPNRRLVFGFHPTLPGLLLTMDYHRGGERRSRLSLSSLNQSDQP